MPARPERERATERAILVQELTLLLINRCRVTPDVAVRIAWEIVLQPGQ